MVKQKHEGFLRIPLVQPPDGFIRDHFCSIAFERAGIALHVDHPGLKIKALAGKDIPEIKTCRVRLQVPFPDYSGLIARFPEDHREGVEGRIKTNPVVDMFIPVRMLACQKRGSGRTADGIANKSFFEQHALFGQPVDIWCADEPTAIGTDGKPVVVVAHDINDIGPLAPNQAGKEQENKKQAHR